MFVVPTNDVFRFSEQTIPVIDKFALSGQHKLNFFALKLFNCTVIKIMTMFVVPTIDVFRFSEHTMANSKNKLDIVHYVHLR